MNKLVAEVFGTFVLVFFGCGSAVIAGDLIGFQGIALTFGFTIVAAAYGIGAISGAHLNPAVSTGVAISGGMSWGAWGQYVIAQIIGALLGSFVLLMIAKGAPDYTLATNGLGQNGWGEGYLGGYSMSAAFTFEVVATFVFVTVILGATGKGAAVGFAGLAIGITLAMIHLVGINIDGTSVNPARSLAPALFVGGTALAQVWLFIVAPLIGGALAGLVYKMGFTQAD